MRVDHSSYAARPASIGSKVLVRIYAQRIEIRDINTAALLRTHAKAERPGTVVLPMDERVFNPSRETRPEGVKTTRFRRKERWRHRNSCNQFRYTGFSPFQSLRRRVLDTIPRPMPIASPTAHPTYQSAGFSVPLSRCRCLTS